jgi:hypothetical protein
MEVLFLITIFKLKIFLNLRQIGPISKVWSEQEMIEKAAYEFQEVYYFWKDLKVYYVKNLLI